MPWVKKYPTSNKRVWVIGIVAGVCFGLLLGYEWWGSTAAVVAVVEKELNSTESHIADLENRVIRLEARVTSQESNPATVVGNSPNGKADGLIRNLNGTADTAQPRAETH